MLARSIQFLKRSFAVFLENQSARRGAAIAFYTVTSIAPVLLIVIAVAGAVFGREAATGALFGQFSGLLGAKNAELLQQTITSSAEHPASGFFASALSIAGLILTASGVFLELEDSLNGVWDAKSEGGIFDMARARIVSLGLVVALGFLLLVSLVIDTGLKSFGGMVGGYLPFGAALLQIVSFAISFALISLIFAAIYKYLPAISIPWRDVLLPSFLTGFLFEVGKFAIGYYLGSSSSFSSLGAAGALLALLFWTYYSAQIFLFGAAMTKAYAERPSAADANLRAHSA